MFLTDKQKIYCKYNLLGRGNNVMALIKLWAFHRILPTCLDFILPIYTTHLITIKTIVLQFSKICQLLAKEKTCHSCLKGPLFLEDLQTILNSEMLSRYPNDLVSHNFLYCKVYTNSSVLFIPSCLNACKQSLHKTRQMLHFPWSNSTIITCNLYPCKQY